ncbi:MAG TPA: tetratricopeptide repeat protein [Bacteroidales bacterium]|nr:tetratricopeptide repeat protein [Bacteroidales bacterium]
MRFFFLLFFISASANFNNFLVAQNTDQTGSNKYAKDNFTLGNYKDALNEYLLLLKNDSLNPLYNYYVGVCYLNTYIDKSKSIFYLERAVSNPKANIDTWYELGRAYMLNYNFTKAKNYFEQYGLLSNGKENFLISSERMIQMCDNAELLIKTPLNISIENLGAEINSAYPDYNPFIPNDESFITFTSKRQGTTGNVLDFDGFNTPDIFISYLQNDKWAKVKSIGTTINTTLVEELVSLSTDGKVLFAYIDNFTALGTTMISYKKGKSYQKPEIIGSLFNPIKYISSACISPDKKTLIIACDLNIQEGGMDLYISQKLPSGEWSVPKNIGSNINTVYDEDFPYFAPDGTLYFCSVGHNSMGGFDIFKTTPKNNFETWSKPENIGYPINTPDDNKTISFTSTGRHAFISSFREGGYGDLDIYKIIFNNIEPAYTTLTGTIMNEESVSIFEIPEITDSLNLSENAEEPIDIGISYNINMFTDTLRSDSSVPKKEIKYKEIKTKISVKNLLTQEITGIYRPNYRSGKYVIILPPGNYELIVEAAGFKKHIEPIKIIEKTNYNEIFKDITLTSEIIEVDQSNLNTWN